MISDDDINQYLEDGSYYGGGTASPGGEAVFPTTIGSILYGCTDPQAYNYNPSATVDDGGCQYTPKVTTINVSPTTKYAGCTDPSAQNYNPQASHDDGSCYWNNYILGCTDATAANFNPSATKNDGSCISVINLPTIQLITGCGDPQATNYNKLATYIDNTLCKYEQPTAVRLGCTNPSAKNYNPLALGDDGSCEFHPSTPVIGIAGCTKTGYQNYNPNATVDDGSCIPHVLGCMISSAENYNSNATLDDGSCRFHTTIYGCTNPNALNYNRFATIDDGQCRFQEPLSTGCKNPSAKNYNPSAFYHDGSLCEYAAAPLAPPQEPPNFASVNLAASVSVLENSNPIKVEFTVVDPAPAGNITFEVEPVELNISPVILGLVNAYVTNAYSTFIDPDRFYKLLLNYGDDKQTVIANYRLNPINRQQLQLKLTTPVPQDIPTNVSVFLGREVAKTFIDNVRIGFAPAKDRTPYLRPRNNKIEVPGNYKQTVQASLETLNLATGSIGTINTIASFEDSIFRKWYSYDWNTTELNQNFTDYNNFVFYGAADLRLKAFREKLRKIEIAQTKSLQSATYITTSSLATGSLSTLAGPITFGSASNDVTVVSGSLVGIGVLQTASIQYALEIEDIIRTFDPYERYLFYGSNTIPYSASADYAENFVEYNTSSTWPKNTAGQLYSITSSAAIDWVENQSTIAQRFDENNQNSLMYLIPSHIYSDVDSDSFMTFILAVGHYFDNIKPYIDQMPTNIYDRRFNPDEGMSIDLVWEIAENFGIKLPNPYSVYSVQQYVLPTVDQETIRNVSAETWKRFLNSLIFLLKSRGTKTAVNSFLRILGIHPQVMSVKESELNTTSSFFITEEFSNGLEFTGTTNSYIKVPMSSSLREVKTLQFRFATAISQNVTLGNTNNSLVLNISPLASDDRYGRLELISGSSIVLSSSYQRMFDNNFIDVMLRKYPSYIDLTVINNDGEEINYSSSYSAISSQLVGLWTASRDFYLGGSGSSKTVTNFDGIVDEVRAWGEIIEDDSFIAQTFDPGSYTGNTYTSSIDSLYTQLSFNREYNLSTRFVGNESPYFNLNGVSDPSDVKARTNIEFIEVEGFVSTSAYTRFNRKVRINTPTIGGSTYTTTKIKIADSPIFQSMDLDTNGVPVLKRNSSIVKLNAKDIKKGTNIVSFTISPTDFQNQNISRAFGGFNINNLIGDPAEIAAPQYKKLKELQDLYSEHFYSKVDANRLIRIFETVLDGMSDFVNFLMPIKSKLQTGILIEPNILERVKVFTYREISVDGSETRRSIDSANSSSIYAASDNIYALEKTIEVKQTSFKPTAGMDEETSYDDYLVEIPVEVGEKEIPKNLSSVSEDAYKTYETLVNIDDTQSISSSISFAELFVSGFKLDMIDSAPAISTQFNSPSELTEASGYFLESLFTEGAIIDENNTLVFTSKSKNSSSIAENAYVTYDSGSDISIQTNFFMGGKDFYGNYNEIGMRTVSESFPTYTALFQTDIQNVSKFGVVYENGRIRYVTDGTGENYPFAMGISLANDINGNPIDRNNINYLYDISPSTDFSDLGVTTYFYKSDGLYRFPERTYSAIGRNTLNFLPGTYTNTRILSGAFAEWEYGTSYNENDVVVQNISSINDIDNPQNSTLKTLKLNIINQIQVVSGSKAQMVEAQDETTRVSLINQLRTEERILDNITEDYNKLRDNFRTALAGNGYFYKFKRKTSITGYNSYIAPAIDRQNWELILYTPSLQQIPKRVLLDTNELDIYSRALAGITIVNPSVTGDVFGRTEFILRNDLITTPSQTVTGVFNLAKISELLAIKFEESTNYRITLYRTATQRSSDIASGREFGQEPINDHGVLFDAIVDNNIYNILNPTVRLVNGDSPEQTAIYYRITNLDAISKVFRLKLYLYVYEGEKKVPIGYLPRHYKFSRDNSTATKRRNYIGCLQTENTTTDGLRPVEVTESSGTDITVSSTSPNESIILGGGGTLNVT